MEKMPIYSSYNGAITWLQGEKGSGNMELSIREMLEQREHQELSPYATFSDCTKGRETEEELCDVRTEFQRDRDRILHCKAFRRLKHKTQVFLAPEGDHYRTRLTHTLEVAQVARTIAKGLSLNEDLTEAIALGHDLGHTPFGHAGERALNQVCPNGFAHHKQSIRVVTLLEKEGKGLNLTAEVRDGIFHHQTSGHPSTLEGKIVRLSDKIAYTNHDIADAVRAGIIDVREVPKKWTDILGNRKSQRLNVLIHDVIKNSYGKNDIQISPKMHEALYGMRSFLYEKVYTRPRAKREEKKARGVLHQLYEYYLQELEQLPIEYQKLITERGQDEKQVVCDYVAGMTDNYAIRKYTDCFIPTVWK